MPFLDYIMSVNLPREFKPPTDMESYDRSTDPQEHMDVFKSRMALAGAFKSYLHFYSLLCKPKELITS